jgi:hypothetical protein
MSLAEAENHLGPSLLGQVCSHCTLSVVGTPEAELATDYLPGRKLTRPVSLVAIGSPSGCRHLRFSLAWKQTVLVMKLRYRLRKKTSRLLKVSVVAVCSLRVVAYA